MEAALRTAYEVVTGKELPSYNAFKDVRGVDGVKEAEYDLNGAKILLSLSS